MDQVDIQKILEYFPEISPLQKEQLQKLGPLYKEWNDKINVISRKDIDNLYERHVLHALSIAKVTKFVPGAEILDLGTGGGFPGIPLAILFPETQFWLVDGTGKKIKVVQEVVDGLELKNVKAKHTRAEDLNHHFDFVICRAVARLHKLIHWGFPRIKSKQQHGLPNGLLALKGGNIFEEIDELANKHYTELYPLTDFFKEDFFIEKYVLYVQR